MKTNERESVSQTMVETLGIQIEIVDKETVRATMPVDHRTCQPFGILNGGASLALAETAAGYGSLNIIPEDKMACGIEVTGNHVGMAYVETQVTAIARLRHGGHLQHVWDVEITTEDGRTASLVRVVNLVIPRTSVEMQRPRPNNLPSEESKE